MFILLFGVLKKNTKKNLAVSIALKIHASIYFYSHIFL